MSAVRPASPGKTRTCPHCKAVILDSASVCPGCQHHLRFGSDAGPKVAARTALAVEGKIKHPPHEDAWEYTVVVLVRNERDEEIARHVINVGALEGAEERVVSLAVEVMPPKPSCRFRRRRRPPSPSSLAASRPPLIPPPPAANTPRIPTPPVSSSQPLPPAKETLSPPRPGDPYKAPFKR